MKLSTTMKSLFNAMLIGVASNNVYALPVFTNGSFESGNASGWTVVNPFIGNQGVNNWSAVGGLPAMDGTYAVWFGATDTNGTTSYSQTLSGFNIGDLYTVSFGMIPERGSNNGRPGAFALLDMIGTNIAHSRFGADCANPNDNSFISCPPGWQNETLTFMALAQSVSFTWRAEVVTSPSWEFGFDNVRLTNAVPEPATIALLGLGFVGIGNMRRSKSIQA